MKAHNGRWSDWQQHGRRCLSLAASGVMRQRPRVTSELVVRGTAGERHPKRVTGWTVIYDFSKGSASKHKCPQERHLMLQCGSKRKLRAKDSRHCQAKMHSWPVKACEA